MQVFRCLLGLVCGLVFVGARNVLEDQIEPRTLTMLPTERTDLIADSRNVSVCQCGTLGGVKIVGGTNVAEGEIPWQVGLGGGSKGNFWIFCGGTLISSNYVITAAHCLDITERYYKVFLGSANLKSLSAVVVGMSQIMPHEGYDPNTIDNDILVIKLAAPVTLTSAVFPACLPRKFTAETFSGKNLVISGWGTTVTGGSTLPTTMLKATVTGISNVQCNNQWGAGSISAGMLCAQAPGKDSCQGDSGGPMTYQASGVTYLVGVVSFGADCADPNYAGVYTRVTNYLSWIDSKTVTPVCSK